MLSNIRQLRIEWCDCDPAGIILYPRYFEMFDSATTALIELALGMSKVEYLKTYDFAGHPPVEARARFRQPTRCGDDVAIDTVLVECGASSFKVEHRITKAGALAAEGFETRLWVVRDRAYPSRVRSQLIPPEVVARFRSPLPRAAGEGDHAKHGRGGSGRSEV
jgi:4-hydroxybenzoyl-CoA thioesterase